MTTDTLSLHRMVTAFGLTLRDVLDRPGTLAVLLAGSDDPNAKMTVVLLDTYGPAFVIKVPTTARAEAAVRGEAQALDQLAHIPLGSLAPSIPRRVGSISHEGRIGLVSTALPGTLMSVGYHGWHHTARRRHVRHDFAAAGAWLSELQSRTAGGSEPVTLISDAVATINRRFAAHPDLDAARRTLAGPAERLAEHATPRTVVHGDFWFGNLLTKGHRVVGVVDWESCVLSGEPLRDVARFAVSYALYLDRHTRPGRHVRGHWGLRAGSWAPGLSHLLRGEGWFAAITQNYLTLALGRLGLPVHLWRDVVIGGIADVAATADHPEFAERHFGLLAQLAPPEATAPVSPQRSGRVRTRLSVTFRAGQPDSADATPPRPVEVADDAVGRDAAASDRGQMVTALAETGGPDSGAPRPSGGPLEQAGPPDKDAAGTRRRAGRKPRTR
jgi:hypothetical protein